MDRDHNGEKTLTKDQIPVIGDHADPYVGLTQGEALWVLSKREYHLVKLWHAMKPVNQFRKPESKTQELEWLFHLNLLGMKPPRDVLANRQKVLVRTMQDLAMLDALEGGEG